MFKIIIFSMALMCLAIPACGQDNAQIRDYETTQGAVTSLDWVGSVIFVNDMRFLVPSDVTIYKGDSSIGFSEVNSGDPVTVTYYDDPPGIHHAVTIVVQYSGDWAV